MTKSARSKGLDYVREVKKILEGIGHTVQGTMFKTVFFNGHLSPVHSDFFGVFDLISFDGKIFIGHQVSTEVNKSTKIKAIQEAHLPGWVWCRFSDEERGAGYEVWMVNGEEVTESEMTYGIRRGIEKCAAKNAKD